MVGSSLKDRFHILKRIASGGFGETFLAQDTHNMNNQCVVKRLLTQSDPRVQKLFDLEAKKLYKLNHEGIPKLIAYFEDGGQFYLVQDFVDGHTLNDEINPSSKWTESQVIDFLLEALEILAYVHSQGSIHRDLKPDNMMRRHADRKLVMIDFGAVREVRQTPSNMAIGAASFAQTVIGTKGYMPAEQAHGEPQFASDVYAMGCIAIYALTGVSPENFEKDRYEIRWRHLVRVSNGLGAIVDKMVRYDVRDRYVNAGEVLTALKALSINRNQAVPPVPPIASPNSVNKTPRVLRPNPPVPSTRRKFIIGLAVATPLAIVAWDWWRRRPAIPESEPTPKPTSALRTETLNNIITVDSSGKEINRRSVQVQYFTEDKIGLPSGAKAIEMALIPAGNFEMGTPASEKQIALESAAKYGLSRETVEKWLDASTPTRKINFAQSFYVSRYAVTQAQWFAVMGTDYDKDGFKKRFGELDNKFKADNRPMVVVNWNDAKAYCVKLSEKTGRNYRLPTDSEWEYSCRAKTTTPFYFGETITAELVNHDSNYPYAKVDKNSAGYRLVTTDVGSFPPNEWGLYDMHGNVWEWCEDVWHENYNGAPTDGSAWLSGGKQTQRLLRGGSWSSSAVACRSAIRDWYIISDRYDTIGFRVAASSLS